jgi:hypothetical protein
MVLEQGFSLRDGVMALSVKVDVFSNLEERHAGGTQFAQKGNPDQIHLRVPAVAARGVTDWGEQADAFVVAQGVHAQAGFFGGLLNAECWLRRDHQGTLQPGVDSRSSGGAHIDSMLPDIAARALSLSLDRDRIAVSDTQPFHVWMQT